MRQKKWIISAEKNSKIWVNYKDKRRKNLIYFPKMLGEILIG